MVDIVLDNLGVFFFADGGPDALVEDFLQEDSECVDIDREIL